MSFDNLTTLTFTKRKPAQSNPIHTQLFIFSFFLSVFDFIIFSTTDKEWIFRVTDLILVNTSNTRTQTNNKHVCCSSWCIYPICGKSRHKNVSFVNNLYFIILFILVLSLFIPFLPLSVAHSLFLCFDGEERSECRERRESVCVRERGRSISCDFIFVPLAQQQ